MTNGHPTKIGHLTKFGHPPKLGLRAIGEPVKLCQEAHSNPSPRLQSGQRKTSPSVVTGPPGQGQLLANLFKSPPIAMLNFLGTLICWNMCYVSCKTIQIFIAIYPF